MFLQNIRQIWWLNQDNLRIDSDGSSNCHQPCHPFLRLESELPAGTAFPGRKSGMKAIAVVSTVCWIFMISYLPFLLISKHLHIFAESEIVYFASEQLVILNIVANPVVYTLLYKSFSEHVAKSLKIGRTKVRVVHIAMSGVEAARTPATGLMAEGSISSSIMHCQPPE